MKFLSLSYIMAIFMFFSVSNRPLAAEGDSEKGKTLYMKYCEVCHGASGEGDGYLFFDPPVADLTSPAIQNKSDAELWRSVHAGVQNTAMGTWKFVLSEEEITLVLAYVRFLGQ